MIKLLNRKDISYQGQMLPCEPDCRVFDLRGKKIFFDSNDLSLFEFPAGIEVDSSSFASREHPFIAASNEDIAHKMLVLQTTYACNLKCRYCFVRAHYCTKENMLSFEDAMRAIGMFQNPKHGKAHNISFFGGEPLLNWELVYKVSQEVVKQSDVYKLPKPHFHITTNATLITEEIAEYCAGLGFSFIVSLDGQEGFHDQNRPYHKGTGSWKDAMRGLEFLANAYKKKQGHGSVPITLRGTFDSKGVDLVDSLKFLNNLMYEGKASHVSMEPSSLGEGCSTDPSRLEDLTIEEIKSAFESEYWKAADWFFEEIRSGRRPSFHHFEMMMQRIYDREPAFSECGAGKGYLSVGPGGKISACHRENGCDCGSLDKGKDEIKLAKWQDNRYFVRALCPECVFRNACGGGCRHDSLQIGNDIHVPNLLECEFKRMYTDPVLWLLSEMTHEQKIQYSKKRSQQPQRQQPQQQQRPQPQTTACALPKKSEDLPKKGQSECGDPNCKCHERK